jgi:hypothetical protein
MAVTYTTAVKNARLEAVVTQIGATGVLEICSAAYASVLATIALNATAGTAVAISDDGTGTHTITGYENISGIFFEPAAIALRAGIPAATNELAAQLGIPTSMAMEAMTDPNSGFSLAMMKWQQPGTANLYISPASIWGSSVGRQAGAAGAITDKAACLLRTA